MSHDILEAAMEYWIDTIMGLDVVPHNFRRGRTFLGCSSNQQTLHDNMVKARQKAIAARALENLGRVNRQEARIQAEKALADYVKARSASRMIAQADRLLKWNEKWENHKQANLDQDMAQQNYSQTIGISERFIGLDHRGIAAFSRSAVQMCAETHTYTKDTLAAFFRAKMFLVDIRDKGADYTLGELQQTLIWIK
jgi:hypothetical protein